MIYDQRFKIWTILQVATVELLQTRPEPSSTKQVDQLADGKMARWPSTKIEGHKWIR
jgi:hypothetical protein